jgi:hypothetical protein
VLYVNAVDPELIVSVSEPFLSFNPDTERPDIDPPSVYEFVAQVTWTLLTPAEVIVPEPLATLHVFPVGCVLIVTEYAAPLATVEPSWKVLAPLLTVNSSEPFLITNPLVVSPVIVPLNAPGLLVHVTAIFDIDWLATVPDALETVQV